MDTDEPVLPHDDDPEGLDELEELAPEPVPVAEAVTGSVTEPLRAVVPKTRPDLKDRREPLYRECRGYRLRLDPQDLPRSSPTCIRT